MADQRLRALERRWQATGSVEDEAAWLRERIRVGDLAEERLFLAAYLGHEPARLAAPQAMEAFAEQLVRAGGPVDETVNYYEHAPCGVLADWGAVLPEQPKDVGVRVSIAACRAALQASPDRAVRAWGDQVVTAIETWLLGPRTPEALRVLADYWWSHTRNPPAAGPGAVPPLGWAVMNAQVLASYDPEGAGPAPDDPEEFERFCVEWAEHRTFIGDVLAGAQHALGVEQTSTIEAAIRDDLVPWLLGRGDPVADRMRAWREVTARSTRKPPPKAPPASAKRKAPAKTRPARKTKTKRSRRT